MLLDDSLNALYEAARIVPVYTREVDGAGRPNFSQGCYACPHGKNNFGRQSIYDTVYFTAYTTAEDDGPVHGGFVANIGDRVWNDAAEAREFIREIRAGGKYLDGFEMRDILGELGFPVRLLSLDHEEPWHPGTINLEEVIQERAGIGEEITEIEFRRFRSIVHGSYWRPDVGMFNAYHLSRGRDVTEENLRAAQAFYNNESYINVVGYYGINRDRVQLNLLRETAVPEIDAANARLARAMR